MKRIRTLLFFALGVMAVSSYTATLHAQTINNFAGNSSSSTGSGADNVQATASNMTTPLRLLYDQANGYLYFTDQGNYRIRRINLSTNVVQTIAGTGSNATGADGVAATASQLSFPGGLALDQAGNLYIVENGSGRVRVLTATAGQVSPSSIISTFLFNGTSGVGDNGPASAAKVSGPNDVAVDQAGNLYVVESGGNRVRKVAATAGVISGNSTVTTIVGTGTSGFAGDNNPATAALLKAPTGIAFDPSGNMYIADAGNNVVRKIAAGGGAITTSSIITTFAGSSAGTSGYGGDNGPATLALMNNPYGVNVDPLGNVFISEYGGNRVRMVNSGGYIITVAGNGTASSGTAGDGGPATATTLSHPAHTAFDNNKNMYIADDGDNRIRIVTGLYCTTVAAGTISSTVVPTTCGPLNTTLTLTGATTAPGTGYQWQSSTDGSTNWTNVGVNAPIYTTAALNTPTYYRVTTTCPASSATATSPVYFLNFTPAVTPSVVITPSPGTSVCIGASVTFTATPTNGGAAPAYIWTKNSGSQAGFTTGTYTTNALSNGDIIACIMTSNATCASPTFVSSPNVTMSVGAAVAPTVSVTANPAGPICSGTNVTFTAAITNGGAAPVYQWQKNGANVGTSLSTYSDNALNNNDIITCVLTSNATCVSPASQTSTGITMTVNQSVVPAVSITANPSGIICNGTPVTFTATPVNGSTTPAYQWKKNGANVGTNSPTYTPATVANNDIISVVMTSSNACAIPTTATASQTMTVNLITAPSVIIAANPGNSVCSGIPVTFTATATNAGAGATYQWTKNGNPVGTSSNTYIDPALANSDLINCVVTATAPCIVPTMATSNNITMTITQSVLPTVVIASNDTTICAGTSVTFTATSTNTGLAPIYQWKKNGNNVGGNSATYTSASLANNDIIACQLTSNATCASPAVLLSNGITMIVHAIVTPTVTVAAVPGTTVCPGTTVIFTATPANGGSTPSYQWKKNGNPVGIDSDAYVDDPAINGDAITVTLTSNSTCLSTATANSATTTMTVDPIVIPTVTIVSSTSGTVCAGTATTFTAIPVNGGTTPTYAWRKNGAPVGTNSNTYTSSTLADNDIITCRVTSDANCATPATATSNSITVSITAVTPATATIVSNSGANICLGSVVVFTATTTNGGDNPAYQWRKNGVPVSASTNTYTDATLAENDLVVCQITSNAACVTQPVANSNTIIMTVNPVVTPSVTIKPDMGTSVCSGSTVTFTATPLNGGATPVYDWTKNGQSLANATATYIDNSLATNDVISCTMISNATCVTIPSQVFSNTETMTVTSSVTPAASISSDATGNAISLGQTVTFTVAATNGGTHPSYFWQKNGVAISAATTNTYSTNSLVNNDVISCMVVSNAPCASQDTVTSNALLMEVSTGVSKVAGNSNMIHVYPNPNNGAFTIEGTVADSKEATVEITNILGQIVYKATIPVHNGNLEKQQILMPNESASGIYVLHLKSDSGDMETRLVVQK